MAIVKMKRLRLLAMHTEREELLRRLQTLGCVEVDEPEIDLSDPDWSALARPDGAGLARARDESARLNGALVILDRYAPEKKSLFHPRPMIGTKELFDDEAYRAALDTADQVAEEERQLNTLRAERGRILSQQAALRPWAALDVPLELEGDRTLSVLFGTIPARADYAAMEGEVNASTELAQLTWAGADRELQYFVVVCHASAREAAAEAMRPFGFSQANLRGWTGTAQENLLRLADQISRLDLELGRVRADLTAMAPQREQLRRCADRAAQEIAKEEAKARLVDTADTFFLEGWAPTEDVPRLDAALAGFDCAWEFSEPAPEEYPQVPVKLKNNAVTRSMNVITEMYSLPAYDGIDPNPLMAPFFILFFGMMLADMGYGAVMVAGGLFALRRIRPKDPAFMELIVWCGVSTFLWGALTGSFLGDLIPRLVTMLDPGSTFTMPALFTPLDDIVMIMIGSLVLGAVQILTGMTVSVVKKIRDGQGLDALFDEVTWWVILAGLGVMVCGMALPSAPAVLATAGQIVLVAGVLMLALGGTRKARGFGKVTCFVGLVYNGVTGFFSDTLSYIRLMALMVSGSVIAQVFNTLGATFGNVLLFLVISLLGNTLNLLLSLLGGYVHDLRLQCLEFFGRFYKEGGRPYRPLDIDTKYVNVIKEEE